MSDVVSLHHPEPRIWVCLCGCSTFILLEDGSVRCAACDEATHDGNWFREAPPVGGETEEIPMEDVQGNSSREFALRRIRKIVCDDDTRMVITAKYGGAVHTWTDYETREQGLWMLERLKIAARSIIRQMKGMGFDD